MSFAAPGFLHLNSWPSESTGKSDQDPLYQRLCEFLMKSFRGSITMWAGHVALGHVQLGLHSSPAPTAFPHLLVRCVSQICVLLLWPTCAMLSHSVVSDSLWPLDCSPPGSSVHGTLQARMLEWLAMPSSRGTSRPQDWTCVSYIYFSDLMALLFFYSSQNFLDYT